VRSAPAVAGVARSGDLGYTYGQIAWQTPDSQPAASEPAIYVRIWQRHTAGRWRLVLDISDLVPPAAG
jgi:ketosteroid isomerase-like protein